jgi:cation transport ATPase
MSDVPVEDTERHSQTGRYLVAYRSTFLHTNFFLSKTFICSSCHIMFPRNEVFQAIPFDDATSDAKEPLIATGDAEEEDQQGLEERDLSSFKLSSALLLGLLVGFFTAISANCLAIYVVMKSNTNIIVFSLLWTLFTMVAPLILIWEFIRKSEELLEHTVAKLQCLFGVGALAGTCLACTVMDVLLGTRAHFEYPLAIIVVACFWYKREVTMASATDRKPSSTRRSTAEPTIMTV